MNQPLADAVRQEPPERLLPRRLASEGSRVPGRLELVAGEPLGHGGWLTVLVDERGRRFAAPLVAVGGGVRRAVPGDGAAEAVVARLASGAERAGAAFTWTTTGAARPARGEQEMGVDQTHESVVVGDEGVVKWSVESTPSPTRQVMSHLHAVGFADIPTPWGFVESGGALVASVAGYLPDAVDGWTWCVEDVVAALARTRSGPRFPGQLGDLVGRLHVALATTSSVLPSPEGVADRAAVRGWRARALGSLDRALATVDGPEGERLRDRAHPARARIDQLLRVDSTPTIRAHGDLHVGQILRWRGGLAVTDFDGNPVLPPTDRQEPEPAARDVAGMLQSLDHVGRVVQRRLPGGRAGVVDRWIESAQGDFLDRYRAALAGAGRGDLLDERLLPAFQVEQECREFAYAVTHLPRWRYVPDAALAAMLDGFPAPSADRTRSDTWTQPGS